MSEDRDVERVLVGKVSGPMGGVQVLIIDFWYTKYKSPLITDLLMVTVLFLSARMSERYMQIGSKGALLVVVLLISVWEMAVPTEATTGKCIQVQVSPFSPFSSVPLKSISLWTTCTTVYKPATTLH